MSPIELFWTAKNPFGLFSTPRYRVDELSDACILTLPNIEKNDAGPYKVIFSGRLSDNSKFDMTFKIDQENDIKAQDDNNDQSAG